ncbi:MAG: hypothetical protein ACOC7T_00865 [Planctomycetota bacterium]
MRGRPTRGALRAALLAAVLALAVGAGTAGPSPRRKLDEVAQRMRRAEGMLEEGRLGEPLERAQRRIVSDLDALIAALEERESGGGSRRAASGRKRRPTRPAPGVGPGRRPGRPAEESRLPPAVGREAAARPPQPVEGDWAPGLPPEERKAVADTFRTGRLPARYRELLRAYNKRLAETPAR